MGDLFDIQSTSSFNTDKLTSGEEYDYITRTSLNQGLLQTTGFVNKENVNPAGTWSLGLLQMDFFYRNKPWYAGQFVRRIIPKIIIPDGTKLFFQTILNMQKPALMQVLVRNVDETFRNIKVYLPQTAKGEIDFGFMELFIRELEESRLRKLESYLLRTGLNDYKLTETDYSVLNNFKKLQWQNFRIGKLFEKVPVKKAVKSNVRRYRDCEFCVPVVYCKYGDNGIMYWGRDGEFTALENVISVVYNGVIAAGKVYAQREKTGILAESYFIRMRNTPANHLVNLFCATAMEKSLYQIYSRDYLATWAGRVENNMIVLPVAANGQPDLVAMERLIAVMQKIVIADVAKYSSQRLDATRQVISDNSYSDSSHRSDEGVIVKEVAESIHINESYHEGCIPLYTLRAACGYFEDGEVPEAEGWVDASGNGFKPDPKRHFAVYAKGNSMQPKIQDGDICVFEWYQAGSREGEIVLTECREKDIDYGGMYTIKKYHSEKLVTEEDWQHTKVELIPLNKDYDVIELDGDSEYRTIGIFKCVLRS